MPFTKGSPCPVYGHGTMSVFLDMDYVRFTDPFIYIRVGLPSKKQKAPVRKSKVSSC